MNNWLVYDNRLLFSDVTLFLFVNLVAPIHACARKRKALDTIPIYTE